ncbi:hypothetical protein ACES2L_01270 [Bdellovibrio bacteriovorus]
MYFQVLSFLLSFFTATSLALASGGEEKPAEGGGHGDAAAAAPAKEIKTNEESFNVVQARVSGLEAKVRTGQDEINKLIAAKQTTKDPEKLNEIIKQIIHLHHELAANIKEYDQQRSLLKYRYPEKNQTAGRVYERIDLKSIEEMEGEMSLSSTVKRTLKKVRSQYGIKEKPQVPEDSHTQKKNAPEPGLIDPVILSK